MNNEKKLMTENVLQGWEQNHHETHKAMSEAVARINTAIVCIRQNDPQKAIANLQSALYNIALADFAHDAEQSMMDMLIQIRNLRPEPYPIPDPEPNPDEEEEAYRRQRG